VFLKYFAILVCCGLAGPAISCGLALSPTSIDQFLDADAVVEAYVISERVPEQRNDNTRLEDRTYKHYQIEVRKVLSGDLAEVVGPNNSLEIGTSPRLRLKVGTPLEAFRLRQKSEPSFVPVLYIMALNRAQASDGEVERSGIMGGEEFLRPGYFVNSGSCQRIHILRERSLLGALVQQVLETEIDREERAVILLDYYRRMKSRLPVYYR